MGEGAVKMWGKWMWPMTIVRLAVGMQYLYTEPLIST